MTWQGILYFLGAWFVISLIAAVIIGKAMRKMDGRDTEIHELADQQDEWRRKDVQTIKYRNRSVEKATES